MYRTACASDAFTASNHFCLLRALCVSAVILFLNLQAHGEKIVCLGDSITDGNTYPQLIVQALREGKKEVPVVVNAGIGGDTAAGMLKRLERDVFVHKPSLMTLSVGINDSGGVSAEDFERDVTAIADRVTAREIKLIVMTTSIQGKGREKHAARALEYDAILRKVAAGHHAPVAEVKALMTAARDRGEELLESDQVHPNFEGQRLLVRAVLDAVGYRDVAVPTKLELKAMPGLIADWRIRALGEKEKVDPATVRVDAAWKNLHLPMEEKEPTWWRDDERRRGFAMSLGKVAGVAKHYVAISTVESPAARRGYLNTGAQLEAVWVNGKQVYRNDGWTGWHAGKERIAVDLPAGASTIVIQSGEAFFLSLTEDDQW